MDLISLIVANRERLSVVAILLLTREESFGLVTIARSLLDIKTVGLRLLFSIEALSSSSSSSLLLRSG